MAENPLYEELKANLNAPVILVGMMGTGKSALARGLASKLGDQAIDIDTKIIERAGISITEIFELHGEEAFRRLELEELASVLAQAKERGARPVIATGGGILTNPECAKLIRENSISVWLNADLDHLAARLANDKSRPMLEGAENVKPRLVKLMAEREALYAASNITYMTHQAPLYQSVDELARALLAYLRRSPPKKT